MVNANSLPVGCSVRICERLSSLVKPRGVKRVLVGITAL